MSDLRDRRLERLAAELYAIKTTLLRLEQRLLHIDATLSHLTTGRRQGWCSRCDSPLQPLGVMAPERRS